MRALGVGAVLLLLIGCGGPADRQPAQVDQLVMTGAGGGTAAASVTSVTSSSTGGAVGAGGAGGAALAGSGGTGGAGGAGGLGQGPSTAASTTGGAGGTGGAEAPQPECLGQPDGAACAEDGGRLCKGGSCVAFVQVRCVTDDGGLYRACDGQWWPWSIGYVAEKNGATWTWADCIGMESFGYCASGYECTVQPDVGAMKHGHCQ